MSGGWLIDHFIKQPHFAQRSGSSIYFSFNCNVSFEFNSLDNCKCHSLWELALWELADYVSFPAMSGTVVVFVACFFVLFDKKALSKLAKFWQERL